MSYEMNTLCFLMPIAIETGHEDYAERGEDTFALGSYSYE